MTFLSICGYLFLLIILFVAVTFILYSIRLSSLRVVTIWVRPQRNETDQTFYCITDPKDVSVLNYERILRKKAFENVQMPKPIHFFDDSDINEPFQITVVYHSKEKIPLLSSRNIFDHQCITETIHGNDPDSASFDPMENEMLCDRLSGNTDHPYFKKNRDLIFGIYYAEILKKYPQKNLYLMARSEFSEPLLTKYLRLGFTIVGETTHHERKHWIVRANIQHLIQRQRQQAFLFLLLLLRK